MQSMDVHLQNYFEILKDCLKRANISWLFICIFFIFCWADWCFKQKKEGKNCNPLFKMTFISCVRFVGQIKSLFERTNGCHNPQKVVCRHKVHFKFKQIIQQSCYPIFKTFFMSQQAPFMGDIYWTILVLLHHYYKARGNGWRFSGSTNRSKSCYYYTAFHGNSIHERMEIFQIFFCRPTTVALCGGDTYKGGKLKHHPL